LKDIPSKKVIELLSGRLALEMWPEKYDEISCQRQWRNIIVFKLMIWNSGFAYPYEYYNEINTIRGPLG